MEDFQMNILKNGDVIEGEVIVVTPTYAYLNVNYMMDALLELKNYSYDNVEDLTKVLKVGEKVKVAVVRLGEEMLVVSRTVLERQERLEGLMKQAEEKAVITVSFNEETKGGLVGRYQGVRVFMPKSQTDARRVEDFQPYVNTPLEARIVEFDGRKNQLLVSHRQVVEEKREVILNESIKNFSLESVIPAKVVAVQDNGAVLEAFGMEVWLPGREVSYHRALTPSDVLKVGEEISVKVITINPERKNVVVSKKAIEKTPWAIAMETFKVGNTITGKVVDVITAGAIVEVSQGVTGLVHVSEYSYDRTKKLASNVKAGDEVRVKVLSIEEEKHRISLSIKQLEASPWSQIAESMKIGDVVSGVVKRVTDRAAFVEVSPLVEAILPVSEATIARVSSMRDVLSEGDTVEAQIIDFKPNSEKMELSILAKEVAAERADFEQYQNKQAATASEEITNSIAEQLQSLK
ncbi:MAG: S1 RNA-binding domain-containing protein [Culicoidibacterales bacterium]